MTHHMPSLLTPPCLALPCALQVPGGLGAMTITSHGASLRFMHPDAAAGGAVAGSQQMLSVREALPQLGGGQQISAQHNSVDQLFAQVGVPAEMAPPRGGGGECTPGSSPPGAAGGRCFRSTQGWDTPCRGWVLWEFASRVQWVGGCAGGLVGCVFGVGVSGCEGEGAAIGLVLKRVALRLGRVSLCARRKGCL